MNKILTGIIAFLYLAFASGVVVNIHYCMGKQNGVEYTYDSKNICSNCGMENKKGCCHNDLKIIKLADDHQVAKANITFLQTAVLQNTELAYFSQSIQGLEPTAGISYHSPPDKKGTSHYLFCCVFRI